MSSRSLSEFQESVKVAMEEWEQVRLLLLLHQVYLVGKIQYSDEELWNNILPELSSVQLLIQAWNKKLAEKIQHQSRVDKFKVADQTRIYHHEVHKKHIKQSLILKRMTVSGLIAGHKSCAKYLEHLVADLLLTLFRLGSEY